MWDYKWYTLRDDTVNYYKVFLSTHFNLIDDIRNIIIHYYIDRLWIYSFSSVEIERQYQMYKKSGIIMRNRFYYGIVTTATFNFKTMILTQYYDILSPSTFRLKRI